jgi:hypothetical protein
VSASGSLPVLHREIPWSGATATRAAELQREDDAADAAGAAVLRTTTAIVMNAVIAGTVLANR